MIRRTLLVLSALTGCGGDDGGTVDAPYVPPTITISGTVQVTSATGSQPLAGVVVAALRNSDDGIEAMSTSDANGVYAITITTNGNPLDGYLKATSPNHLDTYLYPPRPVTEDFANASVILVTQATLSLATETLCGGATDATKATVVMQVSLPDNSTIAGATVASSPAAEKYCYDMSGLPNRNATATEADGRAWFVNVPAGRVRVSDTKSGLTFPSHFVTARAGAFTTTLILPE